MDPPAHTRLRAAVAPYFMPRRVKSLEPQIRRFVTECIDAFVDRGRADAVGELGQIVAVRVACLAVGFPERDSAYLVDLVKRFMGREPGVAGMTATGVAAFGEMQEYLQGIARERRAWRGEPENPIDVMLRTPADGQPPDDQLMGAHLILLLVGATETFPKAFASALLRLHQHRDQRAVLVARPELIPQALRECLRYDMPTQFLMRSVVRPFEIGGKRLLPGQSLMFLYPSGNRDEREFADPDRFDIQRNPPRILTFGHGIHRCLGANFAEMEGKVLLEECLRRFPDYTVDEARAERNHTEFVQGFTRLPIEF
jgi:hypothetical protein